MSATCLKTITSRFEKGGELPAEDQSGFFTSPPSPFFFNNSM
jgi:hypothetical protein